ncbi:hypothetical protein ACFWZJ_27000 [Streptomyces massasporeus]
MACDESLDWLETSIDGLQVRTQGAIGTRVLGWEGVLPFSLIPVVMTGVTPMARAPAASKTTQPSVQVHRLAGSRPQPPHRHTPHPSLNGLCRDAEAIRRILRRSGCTEFSDTEDGFVVDSGQDESLLLVACTIDQASAAQRELLWYRQALTTAGMRVGRHPEQRSTLLVRMPPTTG